MSGPIGGEKFLLDGTFYFYRIRVVTNILGTRSRTPMARPPSAHPTDAELEIFKILWDAGPSELGRITSALNRERAVATTTVATTLKVMMQKGWVERTQGPRSYLWVALIGREEATSGLLRK